MRDTVTATLEGGGGGAGQSSADLPPGGWVAPVPTALDYSTEREMVDDPGAGAAAANAAWR
jgi:hypothetical protein